ncbi:cytochrome P450, partial [Ramicandelaber brevisporus]
AVIKEINRLYPPVNQIFHRILLDDFEIVPGYILPKDTSMGIDVSMIHMSEDVWGPDVEEFRPERFLDEDGTPSTNVVSSSWIPFGGGVRQCLGMGMSLLEQKVVLSMIVRRYKTCLPAPD